MQAIALVGTVCFFSMLVGICSFVSQVQPCHLPNHRIITASGLIVRFCADPGSFGEDAA
eukprot:COSAG04_NODE_16386_length_500_cov_1.805486_1_plen_58_part_10